MWDPLCLPISFGDSPQTPWQWWGEGGPLTHNTHKGSNPQISILHYGPQPTHPIHSFNSLLPEGSTDTLSMTTFLRRLGIPPHHHIDSSASTDPVLDLSHLYSDLTLNRLRALVTSQSYTSSLTGINTRTARTQGP